MFYVSVYAFMSLGAFGVMMLLSRAGFEAEQLSDYRGLNQRHPWYAFLLMLLMFSMAGVPPTIGFFAKFSVIQALLEADLIGLAVIAVLLAVVGAYYYLRIVKLMYFDDAEVTLDVWPTLSSRALLTINAVGIVVVLPWVAVLMEYCRVAIESLAR